MLDFYHICEAGMGPEGLFLGFVIIEVGCKGNYIFSEERMLRRFFKGMAVSRYSFLTRRPSLSPERRPLQPPKHIITYKFRLAAAAAIIGGVRCHHWQRPLPIISPPAANLKSMPLLPLRCLPLPVCRAPPLLNAPHRLRFASFKKRSCYG